MAREDLPTDAQLEYAAALGIRVPSGANRGEISDLISATLAAKYPPSKGNLESARELGVEISRPMPKREVFETIWQTLLAEERDVDLAAWFVYRICRGFVGGGQDHPAAKSVTSPVVQGIAEILAADAKILASIRRYEARDMIRFGRWTAQDGEEFEGGSKRTAAYKAAAALIGENLGLRDPNIRTRGRGRVQKTTATQHPGCAIGVIWVVTMLSAALAVGLI